MSAVRMCDNCGSLFSVNEQNWTSFQQKTNETNSYNQGYKEVDMGPCCTKKDGVMPVLRPRAQAEDVVTLAMLEAKAAEEE